MTKIRVCLIFYSYVGVTGTGVQREQKVGNSSRQEGANPDFSSVPPAGPTPAFLQSHSLGVLPSAPLLTAPCPFVTSEAVCR